MELEKQVVSLELAKKLKELGVKQESLFSHGKNGDIFQPMDNENPYVLASAFTVAELGEKMKSITRYDFIVAYSEVMNIPQSDSITSKSADMAHLLMTEPEIGAKMLIYLLENKLI